MIIISSLDNYLLQKCRFQIKFTLSGLFLSICCPTLISPILMTNGLLCALPLAAGQTAMLISLTQLLAISSQCRRK